jgi:hypothetical protein
MSGAVGAAGSDSSNSVIAGYQTAISQLESAGGDKATLDAWLQQVQEAMGGGDNAGGADGIEGTDDGSAPIPPSSEQDPSEQDPSGQDPSGQDPSTPAPVSAPPSSAPPSSAPAQGTGAPSSTAAPSGDVNSEDPATAIAQNLESTFGLTKDQAAGVLGNLQQESSLKGNINQGGVTGAPSSNDADDNANGWGLCQWGGARKQAEIAYAQQHNEDPGSMQANLGFMDQELQGSYSKTITDIKQDSTPEAAALTWDTDYELASAPNMAARDQYAEQFAQQIT